jgi:hypothetical protein
MTDADPAALPQGSLELLQTPLARRFELRSVADLQHRRLRIAARPRAAR